MNEVIERIPLERKGYELIAGAYRWMASCLTGLDSLPCSAPRKKNPKRMNLGMIHETA